MAIKIDKVRKTANRLLLADECQIYKGRDRSGEGVWDDATLTYTPPASDMVYEGPCNVSSLNNFPSDVAEGGSLASVTNSFLKVPADADLSQVWKEDHIVITGVHALGGDLMLLGATFLVDALPEVGTYTVLRQIRIKRYSAVPQ